MGGGARRRSRGGTSGGFLRSRVRFWPRLTWRGPGGAECDERAFLAVADAFLATHYVARLGSVVLCGECGARNDVDAPYERESGGGSGSGSESESESGGESESESRGGIPAFEGFARRA